MVIYSTHFHTSSSPMKKRLEEKEASIKRLQKECARIVNMQELILDYIHYQNRPMPDYVHFVYKMKDQHMNDLQNFL